LSKDERMSRLIFGTPSEELNTNRGAMAEFDSLALVTVDEVGFVVVELVETTRVLVQERVVFLNKEPSDLQEISVTRLTVSGTRSDVPTSDAS